MKYTLIHGIIIQFKILFTKTDAKESIAKKIVPPFEASSGSAAPLKIPDVVGKVKPSSDTFKANVSGLEPVSVNTNSFTAAASPQKSTELSAAAQNASFVHKSIGAEGGFKVNLAGFAAPKPAAMTSSAVATTAAVVTSAAAVTSSAFMATGNAFTIGQSQTFQTGAIFGQKPQDQVMIMSDGLVVSVSSSHAVDRWSGPC